MMQFILDGHGVLPIYSPTMRVAADCEVPLQCSDGRVHPTRSKYHGIEQYAADPVPNGDLVFAGRWSDLLSLIDIFFFVDSLRLFLRI
jgi:hypothetical protein